MKATPILLITAALGAVLLMRSKPLNKTSTPPPSAGGSTGSTGSTKKPRSVRNNNPLNIRYSDSNEWHGQEGGDGEFVKFVKPEYGFRAGYKLIKRYQDAYGLTSIREIINRWAPESDGNHTANYIDFVSSKMDKESYARVSDEEIPEMMWHMSVFEGSRKFTLDQALAGAALA